MKPDSLSRRSFLARSTMAGGAALLSSPLLSSAAPPHDNQLHLATNQYSWLVFYRREGRDFNTSMEEGLKDIVKSGLHGLEPMINQPQDVTRLAPLLKSHGLEMRSLYVNSTLHTKEDAEKSTAQILSIAKAAKAVGTRVFVTNPNPIRWGGSEAKNDAQLRTQAEAMNRLGQQLADLGLTLAYHNHDIELRQGAREFHHMMVGTDPRWVGLCLDAHWIYRGCGNSSVALFDIVKLYGNRAKELHLRQSKDGIWTETFGPGDIDYSALVKELKRQKADPHLVLEVAVEKGTPKTLSPVEAHRRSAEYARKLFGG